MSYSLVIPIYNEEKNILKLINSILTSHLILDTLCKIIIFVDDGSEDKSKVLLKKNLNKCNKFRFISHESNAGYGAAIKSGIEFSKSKTDYVIFIDSDLTNPLSDIKKINYFIEKKVDFIQANRYMGKKNNIEVKRKIVGIFGNLLCKFFMNMKISDYTNGFRAVKLLLYKDICLSENDFSLIMEEKYLLKNKIKTIAEFETNLGTRNKSIKQSSFNYSTNLIFKYLFYSILSLTKYNKKLVKID